MRPGAIAAKQAEKARQEEEERDLEADSAVPFGSLRSALPGLPGGGCKELPQLNEEDLLSIEPSPLNFVGFCFVCAPENPLTAGPGAAAAAPAKAAETVGRLGGLLG